MKQYKKKIKYQLTEEGVQFLKNTKNYSLISEVHFLCMSITTYYIVLQKKPISNATILKICTKYPDFIENTHYQLIND